MCTHNICFYVEISKSITYIITKYSPYLFYWITVFFRKTQKQNKKLRKLRFELFKELGRISMPSWMKTAIQTAQFGKV